MLGKGNGIVHDAFAGDVKYVEEDGEGREGDLCRELQWDEGTPRWVLRPSLCAASNTEGLRRPEHRRPPASQGPPNAPQATPIFRATSVELAFIYSTYMRLLVESSGIGINPDGVNQ